MMKTLLLLGFALNVVLVDANAQQKPPNTLFIVADDMGLNDAVCMAPNKSKHRILTHLQPMVWLWIIIT